MKTTFLPITTAVLLLATLFLASAASASGDDSVQILHHCRSNSEVLNTFTGLGCHEVTGSGPSFAIVGSDVQAMYYATSDCTGTMAWSASAHVDFCETDFQDGSSLNDRVRSVRLVAACPVGPSFSHTDYCFEGGEGDPDCCLCPAGTKWSNVSAYYRQCIPQ